MRNNPNITVIDVDKTSMMEIHRIIDKSGIQNLAFLVVDEELFHVGSLCFTHRHRIAGSSLYKCTEHDYCPDRATAIDGWARSLIDNLKTGEIRPITFMAKCRLLNQQFEWAYKNGYLNLLKSDKNYYECYSSYSNAVYNQWVCKKNADSTASGKQIYAFSIIKSLFPESDTHFKQALPRVYVNTKAPPKNETKVPKEDELSHALAISSDIFSGLTKSLINLEKYPFQISLFGKMKWIVPHENFCYPRNFAPLQGASEIWDYSTGTLIPNQPRNRKKRYREGLLSLERENSNPAILTQHRHRLAKWAHDCFLLLFAANTAINEKQISVLEWHTGTYEVVPAQQGFRTVKWRAGNKRQSFTIAAQFVKRFEEYLELRKLITSNYASNYLFLHVPVMPEDRVRPLQKGCLLKLISAMRSFIDKDFPKVGYRQLRLYKSNYLLKEYGLIVASQLLQSRIGTIAKAYSSAEDDVAAKEISAFYNLLSDAIKAAARKRQQSIPAGHCIKPGNAIAVVEIVSEVSQPACENFITCLFCSNFVVHATDNDLKKLLSLKYFLNEIRHQSTSAEEFNKLNGPTVARIESILTSISKISPELADRVSTIQASVFDHEELSEYWATVLNQLVYLGAIQ
ncbi:integrase [Pseudomonas alkylphenolica]|nr:integrase [Pseudomonas alkylphenolica]